MKQLTSSFLRKCTDYDLNTLLTQHPSIKDSKRKMILREIARRTGRNIRLQ